MSTFETALGTAIGIGIAFIAGKYIWEHYELLKKAKSQPTALPEPAKPLEPVTIKRAEIGYFVFPCGGGSVSPAARPGIASTVDAPWCIICREGDTAGDLAERIVGDSGRYADLVLANSKLGTRGTPGEFIGADEFNFASGVIINGRELKVPEVWKSHIDETGLAKGTLEPWPEAKSRPLVTGTGLVRVTGDDYLSDPVVAPRKPNKRSDHALIALAARSGKRYSLI